MTRFLPDITPSLLGERVLLIVLTGLLLLLHPLTHTLLFGVNFYFMIVFFCCDRLPSRYMGLLALGGVYVDVLSMRPLGISIVEILSVWTFTRAIHIFMPQWTFFVDWLLFGLCYLSYVLLYLFCIPTTLHAAVPLKGYYGLNVLLTLAMYPFLIRLYAVFLPKSIAGGRVHG